MMRARWVWKIACQDLDVLLPLFETSIQAFFPVIWLQVFQSYPKFPRRLLSCQDKPTQEVGLFEAEGTSICDK